MKESVIEVRCMGCNELIATPSDADVELFRLGIHVHNNNECVAKVEALLNKCRHPQYSDGHCASMSCDNYYSKCPKHSYSGRSTAICTVQR